jgi:methylated-DNA-[protein]-cysteine S-methyltransferase
MTTHREATQPQKLTTLVKSPIGPLRLVARAAGRGLAGLLTDAQADDPRFRDARESRDAGAAGDAGRAPFEDAERELREYFAGTRRAFDMPLDEEQGTAFQRDVWKALRAIPFGQTVTYGEIARRIGRPSSVRAVGAAVGQNPWGIVVPCHRVVGSSGALTGFAGGLARKRWLLEHEGVPVAGGTGKDDPAAKVRGGQLSMSLRASGRA